MSAPVQVTGHRTRCARCDAPIYSDEKVCHYCGGRDEPVENELLNVFLLGSILVLVLAFAVIIK